MNQFQIAAGTSNDAALQWVSAAHPDVEVVAGQPITLRSRARSEHELTMIWKAACSNEVMIAGSTKHRRAVMDLLLG